MSIKFRVKANLMFHIELHKTNQIAELSEFYFFKVYSGVMYGTQ